MSAGTELLRRATEAFNERDLERLRGFYAPDIVADAGELWPAAGAVHGVEGVIAEFDSIFATFERVEVIAEEYIEFGDVYVVPSRWCGTISGSAGVIEQPVVAVYRLRDERVASIEYFTDLDDALRVARDPGPKEEIVAPGAGEVEGGRPPSHAPADAR